jgi:hypothetical protein
VVPTRVIHISVAFVGSSTLPLSNEFRTSADAHSSEELAVGSIPVLADGLAGTALFERSPSRGASSAEQLSDKFCSSSLPVFSPEFEGSKDDKSSDEPAATPLIERSEGFGTTSHLQPSNHFHPSSEAHPTGEAVSSHIALTNGFRGTDVIEMSQKHAISCVVKLSDESIISFRRASSVEFDGSHQIQSSAELIPTGWSQISTQFGASSMPLLSATLGPSSDPHLSGELPVSPGQILTMVFCGSDLTERSGEFGASFVAPSLGEFDGPFPVKSSDELVATPPIESSAEWHFRRTRPVEVLTYNRPRNSF